MPASMPSSTSCFLNDPWFKATMQHSALGMKLALQVPHDVFSTQQIDQGTLLLLKHLPSGEPASVLDLGCGYGALGLPIAARFAGARVDLVDRDLLAVKWAARNASANGLAGVHAYGSLGYRDLHPAGAAYDWILCNVPARIGRPFIEHLLEAGRARLKPDGEVRVVVINDLVPLLLELKEAHQWLVTEVARGSQHSVFSLPAEQGPATPEPSNLYLRDEVEIEGLRLDRPFDLGGDDPKRLRSGLPALLDTLPRRFSGTALSFRCGYGQIPMVLRTRFPEARVVATDRDLLATTFTRRNAGKLGLEGEKLDVRESATLQEAIASSERFDLILGELSPSAGEAVAEAELAFISRTLNPGGEALLLCLEKIHKQWVQPFAKRSGLAIQPLLIREGYAVLSLRGR